MFTCILLLFMTPEKRLKCLSSFQLGRSGLSSSSFQPHLLVLTLNEDREVFIKEHKQLGNKCWIRSTSMLSPNQKVSFGISASRGLDVQDGERKVGDHIVFPKGFSANPFPQCPYRRHRRPQDYGPGSLPPHLHRCTETIRQG